MNRLETLGPPSGRRMRAIERASLSSYYQANITTMFLRENLIYPRHSLPEL